MRSAVVTSCVLLLAGLPAQARLQVFAHTALTVVNQSIPAQTDISTGALLFWSNNHPTFPASARMEVTSGNPVRFTNTVTAFASSPPAIGPHSIRAHLSSPTPVSGTLRVEGSASLTGSMFQVDVRNDGSIELGNTTMFLLSGVYEETLAIPAGGVDVVVMGSASASGLGNYNGNSAVTLSFTPTGANVSRSGSACGAELTGRYLAVNVISVSRSYTLTADNAPVTPHAFFVFGTTPLNVAVPPLGCMLHTDILVPLPAVVAANGRATTSLYVPSGLSGTVLAQFLAATLDPQQNPIWRTSELLRLHL